MYPNAAIGFVIGGASALPALSHRRDRQRLGLVGFVLLLLIFGTTFVLHSLGAGPTVLEALWPDDAFVAATTPVPGRPVVETCIAFIAVALAGIFVTRRGSARWAQGLSLGCVSVGAAAVIGYTIGVDRAGLGSTFVVVGMALHTAVALTFLGMAVLLAQPTVGLFSRLLHSGPSARLSRRLVGVVVVAPIVLTTVNVLLQRWLPDELLLQSVMAIVQVLALGLLVMIPLASADEMEQRTEHALRAARAVGERAGESESIANDIASVLLDRPASPPGWEVGLCQSAAFAAMPGDSCQLLLGEHGRFLVSVFDVAGHGPSSALQAMRLRFEIAALWRAGVPVSRIADIVAVSVHEMNTIATGVLLAVDPESDTCEYVNAGHPPVIALTGSSTDTWERTAPLFGLEPVEHVAKRRAVGRGALLVIYTDGIVEARRAGQAQLGDEAIHRAIRLHSPAGVQAIADACIDSALAHSNTRLRDDALALVLRRT